LLQALIASPKLHQRGAFYVLISGQTFSAAALLIGDLERQLDPVFVGESSAAGPTHVGEDNMILLPNEGLVVLAASRIFVRSFSDDQRSAVAPDIAAPVRFSDYRDGLDPGMSAIAADRVRR
jgi:C-terminal processing protease CtpA/Prc